MVFFKTESRPALKRIALLSKRGRPRIRFAKKDYGTEELQKKRKLLAGNRPEYATSPLGILYARRLINKENFQAGCLYSNLIKQYRLIIHAPKISQASTLGYKARGIYEVSSTKEKKIKKHYMKIANLLIKFGSIMTNTINKIVIDEQYESNIHMEPSKIELNLLNKGLNIIADYFNSRCIS